MRNPFPYPLRAARFSIDLNPFGFWLKPQFRWFRRLTEEAKADGSTIWYFRWAWVQVSFSRWR